MASNREAGVGVSVGDRVDRSLRWGLIVTLIAVIAVLGFGTAVTYRGAPPVPQRVVTPDGAVLYTEADILHGKTVFQRADLMDFGSLYGNGAYFGPDWGADYLHREVTVLRELAALDRYGVAYGELPAGALGVVDEAVAAQLKDNGYAEGTLVLSSARAEAFARIRGEYRRLFVRGDRDLGLPPRTVEGAGEADDLTAFFGWVAWTSAAERPGETYSYTNNWPYEPGAGNEPTGQMYLWTWASLAAMVLLGAGVYVVYRWIIARPATLSSPSIPTEMPLTASQRSTAKWFLLVPGLLLLQALAGVVLAHYYADRSSFFGIDLREVLPFSVVKAWHLQLAIAWIAAAWMGAGLFLAPIVGGREPRRQRLLANALWAAVVVVVLGAAVGLWLGVRGDLGDLSLWFGNQGLEYIQLGRVFQIALLGGLLIWGAILVRAFWPGLRARKGWGSIEHLLLYSGLAIALVYAFGMLSASMSSVTLTDYWRWWVVHLWVENTFEFFTVAVIGYALLSMGLLSRRMVERTVYFELILIFGSGVVGTGHHFYWVGEPAIWLGLGGMFSMLEVIPLAVMMARAWHEYRAIRAAGGEFPHRVPFLFFTWAAVWNVIGAGVLGGIINPPIVSYYEHGTFLTLAHGHASMMGVFGLLALGLLYLAVRGMTVPERWEERLPGWGLRLFNAAIVLWLALNILPIGIAQLQAVVNDGFWYARSLAFYEDWTLMQWFRMPGDIVFLAAGLVLGVDLLRKLRSARRPNVQEGEAFAPMPPALTTESWPRPTTPASIRGDGSKR